MLRDSSFIISGHCLPRGIDKGGGERTQSVAALETVLRELSRQGYVFQNIFVP